MSINNFRQTNFVSIFSNFLYGARRKPYCLLGIKTHVSYQPNVWPFWRTDRTNSAILRSINVRIEKLAIPDIPPNPITVIFLRLSTSERGFVGQELKKCGKFINGSNNWTGVDHLISITLVFGSKTHSFFNGTFVSKSVSERSIQPLLHSRSLRLARASISSVKASVSLLEAELNI